MIQKNFTIAITKINVILKLQVRVGKILQNALKKSENFNKEGSALMIKKFTSGNPIDTQAVVEKFNALPIGRYCLGTKFTQG